MKTTVGDKIKFERERNRYTVQACDSRFVICSKPFNAKKTVLYTVIDLNQDIRGTENLVFGMGAETKEQCEEMLSRLQNNESEVSYRNRIQLDIESITKNT